MNRINGLFQNKPGEILSIYFTAGHPTLNSTADIIKHLAICGADMIEIGMPFSDPMADGPIIQQSSDKALKNGMSLKLLFEQLKDIRKEVNIPLLLMGYLNPVLQFGINNFCRKCAETGIDGIILPDLPLEIFEEEYKDLFEKHYLHKVFLISPQTSELRIRRIDAISNGFIYMVSASSTTGVKGSFSEEQTGYFRRLKAMKLKNPRMIGFGISSHQGFSTACQYAHGAIIGSAFIKMLGEKGYDKENIRDFINGIRG
jgi:tryptophan synthase alpha chain